MVGMKMNFSYVMGIGPSINDLTGGGVTIEAEGENFMVSFPEEKAELWEKFICDHLETGYWNEYLTDQGVVFLFHLKDGIKRYEVYDYDNDEVLGLCETLCECKFGSLKAMLAGNHFYRDKIK